MFNNNNNYPFRGVLGGAPTGAPTPWNYGPRTMFGDQGKLWNPPGRGPGEMNFGQFGGGNAYPFQPFLPAGVGVGGFGGGSGFGGGQQALNGGGMAGWRKRGLAAMGVGDGQPNQVTGGYPTGVLSGGFNRRGF